jgi:hypothetical protein
VSLFDVYFAGLSYMPILQIFQDVKIFVLIVYASLLLYFIITLMHIIYQVITYIILINLILDPFYIKYSMKA